MKLEKLIRQDLIDIKPYPMERQEDETLIWLDMNELPWELNENTQAVKLNRYPFSQTLKLRAQLANFYQVEVENLILTRGSDDGIDALIRLFCQPFQDEVIVSSPTFSMYAVSAKLQGAKIIDVPLNQDNFAWNASEIRRNITEQTKIIFVCTPNNPTGNTVCAKEILQLCEDVAQQAIVVVDEAYIEFADQKSLATIAKCYSNLVVLRTLSKAFGLAGIRCGVVIGDPVLITFLQALMPPFALSRFTLEAAFEATQPRYINKMNGLINIIRMQREYLKEKLASFSFVKEIWPSEANFLLVKCQEANRVYQYCLEKGFLLRRFNGPINLKDCIRISVGLPEQNERLLAVLASL